MQTVARLNWFFATVSLTMVVWGCAQTGSLTDADQERDPFYQKAKKLADASDYRGASEFYEKALMNNPESAPAHFELGLLFDEKLGDPIAAIYHYRQYLALRPDSDKKQLVQDFIERASLSLAGKLPHAPASDPNEVARLRSENAGLMQENLALKARLTELGRAAAVHPTEAAAEATPLAHVTQVANVSPGVPTAEVTKTRTHVVEKGDTLQSLAVRFYGTRSAWDRIYQANRNALSSKDQLRIGQVLVLP
jgi:tetratricopeptide (TPR) repeat protein